MYHHFHSFSKEMARKRTFKVISFVLLLWLVSGLLANQANADAIYVQVNMDGIKYPLTGGYPYSDNGVTMIPFKMLSGKLGIESTWDAKSKKLTIHQNGNTIKLTVGSSIAEMNGNTVSLAAKVIQKDGFTMIPLDLVKDHLSAEVKIDETKGIVNILTPGIDLGPVDDFGRKIRTTNLPKNYKDYPYILEDIPNEMYEMKISPYMYYEPDADTAAELFKRVNFTSEQTNNIALRVKKAYELRLNVDYKTLDPATFANTLFEYENQAIGTRVYKLKEYAQRLKDNKVQLVGAVDPEASMIFSTGGSRYIRSKVRFKIIKYDKFKDVEDIFIDNAFSVKHLKLKKGVWYEGYADIKISTNYFNDFNNHLSTSSFSSIFENSILYEVK